MPCVCTFTLRNKVARRRQQEALRQHSVQQNCLNTLGLHRAAGRKPSLKARAAGGIENTMRTCTRLFVQTRSLLLAGGVEEGQVRCRCGPASAATCGPGALAGELVAEEADGGEVGAAERRRGWNVTRRHTEVTMMLKMDRCARLPAP